MGNPTAELEVRIADLERENEALRLRLGSATGLSADQDRSVLDHSPDGYALCKIIRKEGIPDDLSVLFANKSLQDLFEGEELYHHLFSTLFHSDTADNQPKLAVLLSSNESGIPFKFECCSNGADHWFSATAFPSGDDQVAIVMESITARKKLEEQLIRNELTFRNMFDSAGIAIGITDDHSKWIFVNDQFTQMLGYSREELLEKTIPETDNPADKEETARLLEILRSGEQTEICLEKSIPKKNGSLIYLDLTITAMREDNRFLGLIIAGKDITKRITVEKELKERDQQLELIFDILDVGITISDNKGKVINCNKAAEKILGLHPLIGLSMKMDGERGHYLHPDMTRMHPNEFACVRSLEENKPVKNVELGIVKGEDDVVWIVADATPVSIGEFAVVTTFFDITRQKIASRALAESEANLRAIMESTDEMIALLDNQGRILDMNGSFYRHFGINKEDMIGEVIFNFLSMELDPDLMERCRKTLNLGRPFFGEDHSRGRWMEYTLNPVILQGNITNNVALFVKDVTDRRQAVDEINAIALRYQNLLRAASDGIHVLLPDGSITEASHSFCHMLGYTREELIGMNISQIDFVRTQEEMTRTLAESLEHSVLFTSRHRKKNGEIIDVEVGVKAVQIKEQMYHYASSRDITSRLIAEGKLKRNELKLKELNATKDKFFSIIAHDLKSPFNAIVGFSNLLVEQIKDKDYEGIADYAAIILQTANKSMDLLMNLLEWSRSQTGQLKYRPEYFNLTALIHEIVNLFQDIARQKSILLSVEIHGNYIAFADHSMISTIMRNLLSNAVKFSHLGGSIHVSLLQTTEEQVVQIKDQGVGIDAENIDKLFRIDESFVTQGTQHESGSGLGLILCKDFLEKHNGKIWAISEKGVGSTFSFAIPLIKEDLVKAEMA
ncbi:MAG: PAS domain S-box protein [Marinilabiliales bacterium]|nr:PAS domain S-box protein [Marinilabiliales bacterium]